MNILQISLQDAKYHFSASQSAEFHSLNPKIQDAWFDAYINDLVENDLSEYQVIMVKTDQMIDRSKPFVIFSTK